MFWDTIFPRKAMVWKIYYYVFIINFGGLEECGWLQVFGSNFTIKTCAIWTLRSTLLVHGDGQIEDIIFGFNLADKEWTKNQKVLNGIR